MPDPSTPKVINDYPEEDFESHNKERIAEPRQSILKALRQKAEKDLNSQKVAEYAFALQQADIINLQAMTPEEILIEQETFNSLSDTQVN